MKPLIQILAPFNRVLNELHNNFKQFLFIVVNLFHRQKSNIQGVSNFTEGFNRKTFVETPSIVFLMSGKPASVNPSKDPLFSLCCQEVIMQFSSIKETVQMLIPKNMYTLRPHLFQICKIIKQKNKTKQNKVPRVKKKD